MIEGSSVRIISLVPHSIADIQVALHPSPDNMVRALTNFCVPASVAVHSSSARLSV